MFNFSSRIRDRDRVGIASSRVGACGGIAVGAVAATAFYAPAVPTVVTENGYIPFGGFISRFPGEQAFTIVSDFASNVHEIIPRFPGVYQISYNVPCLSVTPVPTTQLFSLAISVNRNPVSTKASTADDVVSNCVSDSIVFPLQEGDAVGIQALGNPLTVIGSTLASPPNALGSTPTLTLVRLR